MARSICRAAPAEMSSRLPSSTVILAPPPPFAKRVASQLSDVLDEVIEEEQTVRPRTQWRKNHRVVDWLTVCVVW